MTDRDITKTVVTEREDTEQSAATTRQFATKGVELIPMPAWQIALVRTARVYLQSLVGFLTAGATGFAGALGVEMPVGHFWQLLATSAGLALAPSAITLIQNTIELLAKLDSTNPTLRA